MPKKLKHKNWSLLTGREIIRKEKGGCGLLQSPFWGHEAKLIDWCWFCHQLCRSGPIDSRLFRINHSLHQPPTCAKDSACGWRSFTGYHLCAKKTDEELFVNFTNFWFESPIYGRGQVSPRPPQFFGTKNCISYCWKCPPRLAQCVVIWWRFLASR